MMEITESKYDITSAKLIVDSDCLNNQKDEDIIILDDDDFIQTTLSLFNPSEINSNVVSPSNQIETSSNVLNLGIESTEMTNQNQQESILIDLTLCDDFDLNDIFLMNPNSSIPFNSSGSQNSNNQISSQIESQNDDDFKTQAFKIKNEFDFKAFNFNLSNFGSCIEEILIDDDEDDNVNIEDRDDNENENFVNQTLLNLDKNQKNTSNINSNETNAFSTYRTNDSSSESSCATLKVIKQKQTNELKCDKCSKIFTKTYNYKRHLFLHQAKSQQISDLKLNSNFCINECPKCKRKIIDKSNYAKHLKICNLKGAKKCRLDHLSTSISNSFANNKESFDNGLNKKPNILFECEICFKIFNKKFNYHRHIRMHFLNEIMNHQHDPLYNQNETKTTNIINLNNIKIEIYKCDKCMRKFTTNRQLMNHKTKWHLTQYVCSYCEKSNQFVCFNEKFDFIKHLNSTHSVKFKFECKYCKKTFRFISQYIQHKQTHLNRNNFVNNEEKEEEDDQVEMNQDDDLLTNESISNVFKISNQQNKCQICGKCFSKLFNLKRHMSTVHKSNQTETQPVIINQDNSTDTSKLILTSSNNDKTNYINSRLRYECNSNQKNLYQRNKLNFHLNKVNINKA